MYMRGPPPEGRGPPSPKAYVRALGVGESDGASAAERGIYVRETRRGLLVAAVAVGDLLLDGEEDDRHVVDAAPGIGVVDQRAADLVEAAAGGQARLDLGVAQHG